MRHFLYALGYALTALASLMLFAVYAYTGEKVPFFGGLALGLYVAFGFAINYAARREEEEG